MGGRKECREKLTDEALLRGRRGAVRSMGGCMSLGWEGGTFSPRAYGGERWRVVMFE